ncbi:MAG TPA: helix-turn-helix transcriptional regulator [Flavobacterium sp.]|nr:helix-turn-helix transcriptional regulator [Flavobacterium sp.]
MKNYIGLNIKYLCDKKNLKQDEFGLLFDLNKGVIGTYVRESATPKIEVIQKICLHYKITIDDFVNTDLSTPKPYGIRNEKLMTSDETEPGPYMISPNYVKLLEQSLEDKEKIIKSLEEKLGTEGESKTA